MRSLVLGTRGSALALKQAQIVLDALRLVQPNVEVETRVIHTEGDRRQDVSLDVLGGQGVFVKDIELNLQAGHIDLAIHSLKDMPAESPAGLTIGGVLKRGDVRDALITTGHKQIHELSSGDRIGTDSRRRSLQLREMRPDLTVESIRGNVDTRVHKAVSGEIEGVVLAMAGLDRLGLLEHVAQVFSIDEMLPAVGQGILAVQARVEDTEVVDLLRSIDHEHTRFAATAERAYLRRLGAGCRLPVGAYGEVENGNLRLRCFLASETEMIVRDELSGPTGDAGLIGYELADKLLSAAKSRK